MPSLVVGSDCGEEHVPSRALARLRRGSCARIEVLARFAYSCRRYCRRARLACPNCPCPPCGCHDRLDRRPSRGVHKPALEATTPGLGCAIVVTLEPDNLILRQP
eukprot:scaffold5297_cov110-Isochrysis_galbana.AAC.4